MFLDSNMNNVRLSIFGKLSELGKTIKQSWNNVYIFMARELKDIFFWYFELSVNLNYFI